MLVSLGSGFMSRRMRRPEEVSRDHIDTVVVEFLKGEKDKDWTEVSLLTLRLREELRMVLRENADRYRILTKSRFLEIVRRLKAQGVLLQMAYK